MMRCVSRCTSMISALCFFGAQTYPAQAQGLALASPVGRWKTIDDATGGVKSVVVIWKENGKLYGKVERLIDSAPQDLEPRCTRCQGEMKDKPVLGLRILWDFIQDGEQWSGGKVLDPDNGKIYKCSLAVEDGGKKLKVRGFIGVPLLGRTQIWMREK